MNGGVVSPGATIGVLGSGQLGRMFAMAARRMGYRIHTFSPYADTPTGQVADVEVCAGYDDLDALGRFASAVQVVTLEFENVPAEAIHTVERFAPVRPGVDALSITQHRLREKRFLARHGFPTVPFAPATTLNELRTAVAQVGTPAVVKTAAFGYDGKGQHGVGAATNLPQLWDAVQGQEVVVERFVDLQTEISVIAARGLDGKTVEYVPCENRHTDHILDVTTAPAVVPASVAARAGEITRGILEQLHYVGVLCVEFFVTADGALLVNEVAPRPHNSGHLTFDAAVTSQFEQQVRAVCGLPLGSPALIRPAAMANLLGDLWAERDPDWAAALRFPDVKLHLYGKATARPGRKMGHLIALAGSAREAQTLAEAARDALTGPRDRS